MRSAEWPQGEMMPGNGPFPEGTYRLAVTQKFGRLSNIRLSIR